MRFRHKPWAEQEIQNHPEIVIPDPSLNKGDWSSFFERNQDIHLEIGTGKGRFINLLACQMPNVNFIGLEMQTSVIGMALLNIMKLEPERKQANIILIEGFAEDMMDMFAENEISRIYLNFSDPWPKNRHEKRRLTHHDFLEKYRAVLQNNGEVHFKTDNRRLFEYSLNSFAQYGCLLRHISLDLHGEDGPQDSFSRAPSSREVMTEYEQKFVKKEVPIYACTAVMQG